MSKRLFPLFIVCVTIVLLGFGCRGLSTEERTAIRPVTLNYWTVFDDVTVLRQFANEYMAQRPYVKINIRKVRYDEFDSVFTTALADDIGPDVVSMHNRWLGKHRHRLSTMPGSVRVANVEIKEGFKNETIVTIEERRLRGEREIEKEFVDAVYKDVVRDGEIYGLPLAFDTLAIYYNKELLDRAGVPLPPSTWDDFAEAVKQSTVFNSRGDIIQSGVALGEGANISNAFDIVSLLIAQSGVPMSERGRVSFHNGLERNKENHPTRKAIRFFTDFANPTADVYSWNNKQENAFDHFVNGKSVFYFGFAFERQRIEARAPQMNLNVIAVPTLKTEANVANYWIESVVKKTEHPNEAWDFVRYMTTPANIARYITKTGQPTPLRAQYRAQLEDDDLSSFASQILQAENWYTGKNIDAAEEAIDNLIEGFKEPVGDRVQPSQRDAALIINAARIIQQTL
ncbi:MAG: extracellular solute-binding protein [Candidatus Magasanikbacteria bacterium]|nr:extracellular solute-binding protein [Candidatus Magasanikbacteria bacterium]MBT4220894.1 extracellular solute-binding protein [Candidatus Magasanikbacteria bacterium]MBT4350197.1 extracellular solute-binding protein [Candidatus Magasanikbacteria bacterium]MBT6252822.1 extracellular solute-binding protein [Candidatus Magasanikbacteria bacterium]MBT6334389.1 extracellular solute-binding protein [Candidatus Magasanikbacteria bacterium]